MAKVLKYTCLSCDNKMFGNKDGLRCDVCNGPIAPIGEATEAEAVEYYLRKKSKKTNGIIVNVSIKETEVFKGLLDIMKQVTTDKRISVDVREYYIDAVKSIIEKG